MALDSPERGYFSVVRWCPDAMRDEARNIAVVLVDAEGQYGGVKTAPPSALSQDLRQQGLLDAVLHGLEVQFESQGKPDLEFLRRLSSGLDKSLQVTSPKPTAVPDVQLTLQALYKGYVAPAMARRGTTKAVVIDRVVNGLRRRGFSVRRGEYISDFFFDALVDVEGTTMAFDVLSFVGTKKEWTPMERDAGHFLYGLGRLHVPGRAVVQPPGEASSVAAETAWARVCRWFENADVPVLDPREVVDPNLELALRG